MNDERLTMMRGQVVFTRDAAGALGRMLEGTAEEVFTAEHARMQEFLGKFQR